MRFTKISWAIWCIFFQNLETNVEVEIRNDKNNLKYNNTLFTAGFKN